MVATLSRLCQGGSGGNQHGSDTGCDSLLWIGIALGSVISGRVSRGRIETGLVPISALGIAAGLFLLPSLPSVWTMAFDFLMIGIMGGLFLVPLNALIQFNAQATGLGRVLAANNFVQHLVMLAFLGLTVVAARLQSGSLPIIYALGILALAGICYTFYQLPQPLVCFLMARLVMARYRLTVIGLANLTLQGGVLMLGNHISWIDWAIL